MFTSELDQFQGERKITKEFILTHITEADIFYRYLGIHPTNKKIKSPLRQDKHADCGFYVNKYNRIKFYDKAKSINEDCFGIVSLLYKTNFMDTLVKIAYDFGLLSGTLHISPYREEDAKLYDSLKGSLVTNIEIQVREFTNNDLAYWKQFNIDKNLLKQGDCYAVETAWINSKIYYLYKTFDPCYAYVFKANKTIKLYWPHRKKGQMKFYTMADIYPLSGYDKLPYVGDYVIITKSWKDEYSIKSFGIKNVCSMQSENGAIDFEIMSDLYNRYDNIFTLFDYDAGGIKCTKINKQLYPFVKPLFIKDDSKDFSGYVRKYGINKGRELVQKFEEYVKQFIYQ